MEKIKRLEKVTNVEVLECIGHILRRNCFTNDAIKEHFTELKVLGGRRKLLDFRNIRRYWEHIVQDPSAARPYLFSDGQNMYNRVVLVCTVNVYIPLAWTNGQFSDTRYYIYLRGCLAPTIGLTAYKLY